MHGMDFLGRQSTNNGKPKDVIVEISMDGTTWMPAATLVLQNSNVLQQMYFDEGFNQQAKYFKVTVTSAYFANYTHLAELYAY